MRSYSATFFVSLLSVAVLGGCSESNKRSKSDDKNGENPAELVKDNRPEAEVDEPDTPKSLEKKSFAGYTFYYGYLDYDEEKYGFSNLGILKIFKGNKLIYHDTFKGEGPLDIESLGFHNLAGRKLVFCFNYGTAACDYQYNAKYYVVDKNDVKLIKETWSFSGGDQYSSRGYKHIFPTDSAGKPNSLLIVEGRVFHEKDQPDRFDTTYVKFSKTGFKLSKPTDNLSKVK